VTVDELLANARKAEEIRALPATAARGAEAYFQAYYFVAVDNPNETPITLRIMADEYLSMTASPPLSNEEEEASELARFILRRLNPR